MITSYSALPILTKPTLNSKRKKKNNFNAICKYHKKIIEHIHKKYILFALNRILIPFKRKKNNST